MTKWRPDKNPRFRDQAFAGITGVLLSFQQFDIALELTSSPDETGEITGSYVSICNVKVYVGTRRVLIHAVFISIWPTLTCRWTLGPLLAGSLENDGMY